MRAVAALLGIVFALSGSGVAHAAVEVKPQFYGMYALYDGRLIEIPESQPQGFAFSASDTGIVTKPNNVQFASGKFSFLIYNREIATSAPDTVYVNILARVARGRDIDFSGHEKVTENTGIWKERSVGYRYRVAPFGSNREMLLVRPADSTFTLPNGRYVLHILGKRYDFLVGTESGTNRQHCLERVLNRLSVDYVECPLRASEITDQDWSEYTYREARVAISFPAEPKALTGTKTTDAGFRSATYEWTDDSQGLSIYFLPLAARFAQSPDEFFDRATVTFGKIVTTKPVLVGGHAGREVDYEDNSHGITIYGRAWIFALDGTFIKIEWRHAARINELNRLAAKFFSSFRFLTA